MSVVDPVGGKDAKDVEQVVSRGSTPLDKKTISVAAACSVLVFLLTIAFWGGTKNSSVEGLGLQVAELKVSVDALTKELAASNVINTSKISALDAQMTNVMNLLQNNTSDIRNLYETNREYSSIQPRH